MTKVINLYAGPGAGKSTNAAKTFSLLKEQGHNAELVNEYVKLWAWEDRRPVDYDQFYFFAKQMRSETRLYGKVDVIVTDAPVILTAYYTQVYGSPEQAVLFRQMYLTFLKMCAEKGHQHEHFFINRTKKYDPRGRFQNEAEARKVDEDLRRFISELGIKPIEVDGDAHCAERIIGYVYGAPTDKAAA